MATTTHIFRNGVWIDKASGLPVPPLDDETKIFAPMIVRDIPAYRSPIDGRIINTRSERRDDLRRHNCVEYEPSLSPTKGRIRNEKFAANRGLQVSEEFRK